MKALIAIDGSTESALGVETAASLNWPAGSRLEVLTVLPTDLELFGGPWAVGVAYIPSEEMRDRIQAERQVAVDRATARLRRPGLDVGGRIVVGRAASVIIETARSMEADLIILGARGHGLIEGALLGSVSAEVVDQAHSAVLVARRPTTGRVLIGTDGSGVATSAVAFVASSGLFAGAETMIVDATDLHPDWWLGFTPGDAAFATDAYVTVLAEGRQRASDVISSAAGVLRSHGLSPSTAVIDGPAGTAILDAAKTWAADVVVVGTRGNGLLKRLLLGSTARSLLHHAPGSVLIVRGRSSAVATDGSAIAAVPTSVGRA